MMPEVPSLGREDNRTWRGGWGGQTTRTRPFTKAGLQKVVLGDCLASPQSQLVTRPRQSEEGAPLRGPTLGSKKQPQIPSICVYEVGEGQERRGQTSDTHTEGSGASPDPPPCLPSQPRPLESGLRLGRPGTPAERGRLECHTFHLLPGRPLCSGSSGGLPLAPLGAAFWEHPWRAHSLSYSDQFGSLKPPVTPSRLYPHSV